MTTPEPCPYRIGRRACVAGPKGHAGPHDWPPVPRVRRPFVCEGYNDRGAWIDCARTDRHGHGIVADGLRG